jgi:UDP:flavonoid glycosyltransferase YjiC (YdhE family)
VPFFADQPFWARRVAEAGIGPPGIPRKNLTSDRLALAIRQATSPETDDRAQRVGRTVTAERGIENAVERVGELGENT